MYRNYSVVSQNRAPKILQSLFMGPPKWLLILEKPRFYNIGFYRDPLPTLPSTLLSFWIYQKNPARHCCNCPACTTSGRCCNASSQLYSDYPSWGSQDLQDSFSGSLFQGIYFRVYTRKIPMLRHTHMQFPPPT